LAALIAHDQSRPCRTKIQSSRYNELCRGGFGSSDLVNPSRCWDEAQFPRVDVATVEITEALDDAATERMRMWLGHQPPSLGLTDADSAVDYLSLVYARYHVYPTSQGNRKWLRSLGILRKMPADF
jgi:hypothetical protein